MRYRSKLTIALLGTTGLCAGASSYFAFTQSKRILVEEIRSKVLAIAATTAPFVDGDQHARLRTPQDESSPAYREIERVLRKVRDTNLKNKIPTSYIYTMTSRDGQIHFGVDPEEDPKNKSHLGDVYSGHFDGKFEISQHQVDSKFTVDKWGTWLSANAPVLDQHGKVVASVGVDLDAKDVLAKVNLVFIWTALALVLSVLIAVAIALYLAKHLTVPLDRIKKVVGEIGQGDLDCRVVLNTKDEFAEVGHAINSMAIGLQEREHIKGVFARYVSQEVLDTIVSSPEDWRIHGERKKVTVLFSDIRGFSTFSENLKPEETVSVLNEYFERMIDIVFKNKGTLDKFIGDGMMVVFGAPLPDDQQEQHAVQAAIEMQQALTELRKKWEAEGKHPVRIGVGIYTGHAVVGNIGSSQRMEFTTIGDTVNVASRLESATKEVQREILIGDSTFKALSNGFKTEHIGPISVKGRQNKVDVYSVSPNENAVQLNKAV